MRVVKRAGALGRLAHARSRLGRAGGWAAALVWASAAGWAAEPAAKTTGKEAMEARWPGLIEPGRRIEEPNATLKALFEAHRSRGFTATFKESKHVALLERPLESSGTLEYRPERVLVRRMETPFRQELIITPKRIERRDAEGRVERLTGAADAFATSMRDAMLGVFSGSWDALSRQFEVNFMERDAGWVAALKPNDARLSRLVHALVLEGRGERLTDLWVMEENGNWTHDEFSVD